MSRLATQAEIPAEHAAEALAEAYSQIFDQDVFIETEEGQRVLRHKGVTLAVVAPCGLITVFASAIELASLALAEAS